MKNFYSFMGILGMLAQHQCLASSPIEKILDDNPSNLSERLKIAQTQPRSLSPLLYLDLLDESTKDQDALSQKESDVDQEKYESSTSSASDRYERFSSSPDYTASAPDDLGSRAPYSSEEYENLSDFSLSESDDDYFKVENPKESKHPFQDTYGPELVPELASNSPGILNKIEDQEESALPLKNIHVLRLFSEPIGNSFEVLNSDIYRSALEEKGLPLKNVVHTSLFASNSYANNFTFLKVCLSPYLNRDVNLYDFIITNKQTTKFIASDAILYETLSLLKVGGFAVFTDLDENYGDKFNASQMSPKMTSDEWESGTTPYYNQDGLGLLDFKFAKYDGKEIDYHDLKLKIQFCKYGNFMTTSRFPEIPAAYRYIFSVGNLEDPFMHRRTFHSRMLMIKLIENNN